MTVILRVLKDIVAIPELRKRILFTVGLLSISRVGFQILIPGVNKQVLDNLMERQAQGGGILDWLRYTSAITGGALHEAMVFSLGIMPYISASIIFSLLVKVFPRLEELSKEGEQGRRIINRYTRYATVLLCIVQALFVVAYLRKSWGPREDPLSPGGWFLGTIQVFSLTTGTIFLMWLGEKITESGIGNGASLLIMAGIISRMPAGVYRMLTQFLNAGPDDKPFHAFKVFALISLFVLVVVAVVFITKGQRRIPVQQARTVKGRKVYGGMRQYMPIRVNSAGVLPIIFAQSLIILPSAILGMIWAPIQRIFAPHQFWYYICYILLIWFFTYFWTNLMFNPVEIANNMKEHGSFIPGIRPGRRTAEYLERILERITLAGSVFLALIAVIPEFISASLHVDLFVSGFLGGTSILIVVGVALDLVDKIEAQLLVRHYEGFMRGGSPRRPGPRVR